MIEVNGKSYPMWSQFVEGKAKWVGGEMFSTCSIMGASPKTTITDVELVPNGEESAMICFRGEDFDCCSDVLYCGVSGKSAYVDYLKISTQWGDCFYLKGKS